MAASRKQTANEYLAEHPEMIRAFYAHITADATADPESGCLTTSYACASASPSGPKKSRTDYPVTSRTGPDHKKRKYYLHHVAMMYKRLCAGIVGMWDTDTHQVSHECHNTACVNVGHLELLTAKANRDKNVHCVGTAVCATCGVSMRICKHPTKCLTVVETVCSTCEEL